MALRKENRHMCDLTNQIFSHSEPESLLIIQLGWWIAHVWLHYPSHCHQHYHLSITIVPTKNRILKWTFISVISVTDSNCMLRLFLLLCPNVLGKKTNLANIWICSISWTFWTLDVMQSTGSGWVFQVIFPSCQVGIP
jgi:hypothetical protein